MENVIHCKYDKLVDVIELVPNPRNANNHPEKQIKMLAKIIAHTGWRHPVIVSNRSGFICAGHGRLAAAQLNGLETVPVVYQDFENEAEEFRFLIADNKVGILAEHDDSLMLDGIRDLNLGDTDFELMGLDDFNIDEPAEAQCDEDEIPEHVEPKAKLGDLYQLGEHVLLCGDATSIDAVDKLMGGAKADMVFTDPPYNTGTTGETQKGSGGLWKGNSKGKARLSHMFNDSYTDEEWEDFMSAFCSIYYSVMKEDSVAYICLDWRRNYQLIPHIENHFKRSNLIVWDKMVHGLGSDYKYTHEFINVCKKGKPELKTNTGDSDYKDIWHIQRKMGKDKDHATKKPIEIIERAIKHSFKAKSVLDLFGGSGSTLIACEKTNRKCYMCELDPKYIDVIVARWEKYTGKTAELING